MALTPYQQLEIEFTRLHAFRGAASVLHWDAAVMMPPGAAALRADQLAAIESQGHALLIAPRISRLLERAEAGRQGLDEWQLANLREMRRERDHAIAMPARLVARLARATAIAEARWLEARKARDFKVLAPHLTEVIALVRDKAALRGAALAVAPYDALVDDFSPGLRCADIDPIFSNLARRLPGLIDRATAAQPQALPLQGRYSVGKQRELGLEVMRALGFPFDCGRLDASEHPFTGGVPGDIRVTARFNVSEPFSGLLAILHETGHALYYHGLPQDWRTQPVGRDRGMMVQESQSLLIEMLIARGLPFLTWLAPRLRRAFGTSGPEWEPEALHARLIRVVRGPVRIDADELTYPVHVMIRYDLERQLLTGEIRVDDLPAAWTSAMEARLGVTPRDDFEGCLQDVHWAGGAFGYFPSYALGAVLAAQIQETLRAAHPGLDGEIAAGRFESLTEWLKAEIHGRASLLPSAGLVTEATGRTLSALPWLRHAEARYLS
jgi:carboxypeptidase Taq